MEVDILRQWVLVLFFAALVFALFLFFWYKNRAEPDVDPDFQTYEAYYFLEGESIAGILSLSSENLEFTPHNAVLMPKKLIVPFKEIKDVAYFNNLGFIPNGLDVMAGNGKKERFVISNRAFWKKEILERAEKSR